MINSRLLKLNVGCGWDIREGYVNLDYSPKTTAVQKYDLKDALPYKDGSVDEIYCSHVLEDFLYEFPGIVKDFARVLKKGGLLHIKVPYGVNIDSIHHKRFFNEQTFKSLAFENFEYEDQGLFSEVEVRVVREGVLTQFFKFFFDKQQGVVQQKAYSGYLKHKGLIDLLYKLDLKIGKKKELDVRLIK